MRLVVRFRGRGARPERDVERIRSLPNLKVVDDSSSCMLLVDAPADELRDLIASMPGWIVSREEFVPLPDTRQKLGSK